MDETMRQWQTLTKTARTLVVTSDGEAGAHVARKSHDSSWYPERSCRWKEILIGTNSAHRVVWSREKGGCSHPVSDRHRRANRCTQPTFWRAVENNLDDII